MTFPFLDGVTLGPRNLVPPTSEVISPALVDQHIKRVKWLVWAWQSCNSSHSAASDETILMQSGNKWGSAK